MKERKTVHLVCSIVEVNGEMEYGSMFIVKVEKGQDRTKVIEKVWSEYRGSCGDTEKERKRELRKQRRELEEDGGYWSDHTVVLYPDMQGELTDAEYEVMSKYLAVLT